jgi:crotonobetainyl-CoA:carnitine CoA-transferase CaiB-like acyl-CoA transferase
VWFRRRCSRRNTSSAGLVGHKALRTRASDLADDERAVVEGIFVETANAELPLALLCPSPSTTCPCRQRGPARRSASISAEVLAEAGLTPEEIAALKSRGVVE